MTEKSSVDMIPEIALEYIAQGHAVALANGDQDMGIIAAPGWGTTGNSR